RSRRPAASSFRAQQLAPEADHVRLVRPRVTLIPVAPGGEVRQLELASQLLRQAADDRTKIRARLHSGAERARQLVDLFGWKSKESIGDTGGTPVEVLGAQNLFLGSHARRCLLSIPVRGRRQVLVNRAACNRVVEDPADQLRITLLHLLDLGRDRSRQMYLQINGARFPHASLAAFRVDREW